MKNNKMTKQCESKRINLKIKSLNFNEFPRTFLEELLNYIRQEDYARFKRLLLDFEKNTETKIINVPKLENIKSEVKPKWK
jgi:hypothetical protein